MAPKAAGLGAMKSAFINDVDKTPVGCHWVSSQQAAQQIVQLRTSIFEDKAALLSILERFETIIHKRWDKKTMEKRRALLLRAFPGIPRKHRPDFEEIQKGPGRRSQLTPE
ncbi:MAG: hypothetical protein Q9183_007004, partial [Haloplaca sp. 2 TL-2023]